MTLDLTLAAGAIAVIVGYYAVLFALSLARAAQPTSTYRPLMVLLVPARNEELVLDRTLETVARLEYDGPVRVLVVDDDSQDATAAIAGRWARRDERIRLTRRVPPDAGLGKSEALNHGHGLISAWRAADDPWLEGRGADDVVVVILDADGLLPADALTTVAPYFAEPEVASVQVGVRIGNARDNLLTRMQDIEFVGFSRLVQVARDRLGSSGLGGNGQFTRLSALDGLADEDGQAWSPGALTEDLDLGLRLVVAGWRTRFCHATHVEQQGVVGWRALLRQRTRWIQGHYQCWRHIPGLLRPGRVPLVGRLDLVLYLVLVVTVLLVSVTMLLSIAAILGLPATNHLLGFVPYGPQRRGVELLVSLLPLALFLGTYQRHSPHRFRWYEVPAAGLLFTAYGYVWAWVSLRALANLALGRNAWVKTPRSAMAGLNAAMTTDLTGPSLAAAIDARCRLSGTFTLRSGQVSHEYFDKYLFEADPVLLRRVAQAMVPLLPAGDDAPDLLGGLELGGVPIATMVSSLTGTPALFVRKQAKEYGTAKLAEGPEFAGRRVVLIEDVITTGGAVRDATVALREAGAIVEVVVCAIDRSPEDQTPLADLGLEIRAVLTKAELDAVRAGAAGAAATAGA
ncbi:orotate phosphoribosyltransferase [Nocardioides sp. TRM66260-LWL]|uniref:orotate phosphoribosyltransferase n=1 Tax=Nocardioides sp. TRM66260-LWL TaxID=2874478 RepID=UPI001CC5B807|nr:orotate phosphoribosyltransferase [Nocardioides sp. TRM66260-LWL]MBZ5735692.1 orotate phosphoribosyltransferase [Nocardioides sp. TRM66260-LWL]